jgi:hypothetical protein
MAQHSHNEFLEVGATQGIVAALLLVLVAVGVARQVGAAGRRSATASSAALIALSMNVDLTFRVPAMCALLGTVCGLAISEARTPHKTDAPPESDDPHAEEVEDEGDVIASNRP